MGGMNILSKCQLPISYGLDGKVILTLKLLGGQMALSLNLNVKIYVQFLWASASELQPKTFAKNSAILKEEENLIDLELWSISQ